MIVTYPDRQSWLAGRADTLGASESAAAIGLSPWESPYSVWCRKTKRLPERDLSDVEVVDWGNRLEKPIFEAFADRTGRRVTWNDTHTVALDDDNPFLSATLDAVQFADNLPGPGALEIKTTSEWNAKTWDDDRPPDHMRVQLQQQMLCGRLQWGSIAVLVGGQRLIMHTERFNEKFWSNAMPALQEFWSCVNQNREPKIDNHKATARAIAELFPMDNGEVVELPEGTAEWCRDLIAVKSKINELQHVRRGLESHIKHAMGEAECGVAGGYVVKYPTISRAGYEVQPTEYRRLTIKEN